MVEVEKISVDKLVMVGKMKVIKVKKSKLWDELNHTEREIAEILKNPMYYGFAIGAEKKFVKRLEERRDEIKRKLVHVKEVDKEEELVRVMQMLQGECDAFGYKLDLEKDRHWLKIREQREYSNPVYNWRFYINDHAFAQVNTGVDRKGNNFRLEWNPNLVTEEEAIFLKELLMHVEEKRFTRIDLALDIRSNLSRLKVEDGKQRKIRTFQSGRGDLESRYCGTKYSDVEVKLYNKALERRDKTGVEIDGDWWRLEETIRGDAVKDWENHQWFEEIKIVRGVSAYKSVDDIVFPSSMSAAEKAKVISCVVLPEMINEFSPPTQRKIRKIIGELVRVDVGRREFDPCEFVKKEKSFDLGRIKRTLNDLLSL